ncbi:MAG: hypothetical protein R3C05_03195 [Pirellulaceae bacterium]
MPRLSAVRPRAATDGGKERWRGERVLGILFTDEPLDYIWRVQY